MKKSIKTLILTALLVMAGSLSAQSLINGGFDYMQLRVGDNKPANYPGFHVGAATNVALSKHIGVTPGIFFSRHTADNKTAVAGITHHSKYTESTVNIPVLPNVRLYLSEISYFYIFEDRQCFGGDAPLQHQHHVRCRLQAGFCQHHPRRNGQPVQPALQERYRPEGLPRLCQCRFRVLIPPT